MSRLVGCGAALACAVALAGCGEGASTVSEPHRGAAVARPLVCPDRSTSVRERFRALVRARSTRVTGGELAPAGVQSTTVCDYPPKVLKGGPLDSLLNSARPYGGQPCAANYISPQLVILHYAKSDREFVIEMDGCPGVRLHDGVELIFGNSALLRATRALAAGGLVPTKPRPSG